MPAVEGAHRVDPVEVLHVLPDFRVGQALIRHREVVELLQHHLGIGVGLEHFLRSLEPFREPVVAAPLRDPRDIGPELPALADRMAGEALAFEGEFPGDGFGIGRHGFGSRQVVMLELPLLGLDGGRDQADRSLRGVGEVVIDHDVGAVLRDHEFHDRAVGRAEQHRLHAAELVVRIALEPHPVEDRSDHVKARSLARTDVEHVEAHALPGFGCERLLDHAVVRPVEYGMGRLRRSQPVAVEHVERRPADLPLLRVWLRVELALHDHVFAIDPGGIAAARLDHHRPVHARGDVLENHRRAAVIHEDARIIERELELDRLARRDRSVLVLGRDHRRVEIHRMHHRRGGELHAGHGLVAAVGHAELDPVSDPRAHRRPRYLVTESPGAEFHPRCDLDDLVRGIEAHFLHR